MAELVELDAVEVLAIIDNELDPISPCPSREIPQFGGIRDIATREPLAKDDTRGEGFEFKMKNICCSAHGLSLLVTGIKDGQRRTMLFDAGPEQSAWERNATRLRVNAAQIEVIQLSHWHSDHSSGIPMALDMISKSKAQTQRAQAPIHVDLHPRRPHFRGMKAPDMPMVALEADPTFSEIEAHGGTVVKSDQPHTVLDGMFLVSGEIPRTTSYERGIKFAMRMEEETATWTSDELIKDERFLMCKVKGKGVVVFTGCSHAGVVNVARHAAHLGNETPLYAVMGGFHLADAQPEQIDATVEDLAALRPKLLIPGHCTGWRAKFAIQNKMPGQMVPCFVGSSFVL